MIARLFVVLPFLLAIPEGEEFIVPEYQDNGYLIHIFPPIRSDHAPAFDGPEKITINGVRAFQADVLRIDFVKDTFDRRRNGHYDPPLDMMRWTVNSFLRRIRHVAQSPQIHPLDLADSRWRLLYLNDDETELIEDEKLIRGRGALQISFSVTALNKEVWNDIQSLTPNYEPEPWQDLLLDAMEQTSSVSHGIILAVTALEVCIASILDCLITTKGIDQGLWKFINKRDDHYKEPSIEEQYDVLLKYLTGQSLKDEHDLWISFKNLKSARNSFVHGGVAKIGGKPITENEGRKLIIAALNITTKIRDWLPQECQWSVFRRSIKVEITKPFM